MKTIFSVLMMLIASTVLAQTKVVVIPMSGDDIKPLKNVITVAKENGDFTDPVTALKAIGDTLPAAGETNPYLVVIAPGIYILSESLIMKDYVDIAGSGSKITRLVGSASSATPDPSVSALAVCMVNAKLSGVTLENVNPQNQYGFGMLLMDNCTASDIKVSVWRGLTVGGLYIAGSPTIRNVDVELVDGVNQVGIGVSDSSARISHTNILISGGQSSQAGMQIDISTGLALSDIDIKVETGNSSQRGISINESVISLTGVRIDLPDGPSNQTGVDLNNSSAEIQSSTVSINGAGGINRGIALTNISTARISGTQIDVKNIGGTSTGIWMDDDDSYARIGNSTISGLSQSIDAKSGDLSQETYISDSILTGSTAGDPLCSFTFDNTGTELSATGCNP